MIGAAWAVVPDGPHAARRASRYPEKKAQVLQKIPPNRVGEPADLVQLAHGG